MIKTYNRNNTLSFLLIFFAIYPLIAYFVVTLLEIPVDYFTKLLILPIFLHIFYSNKFQLTISTHVKYLFLFTCYITISDYFVGNFSIRYYIMKNEAIWLLLTLIIIENSYFKNKKIAKYVFNILIFVIILSFLFSVLQVFDPTFLVKPLYLAENRDILSRVEAYRITSIYSWSSRLGHGLTFLPILAIILGTWFLKKKHKAIYLFYLLGAIFVFLSKSRWLYLNYLVLLTLLITYSKANIVKKVFSVVALTTVVIILVFSFLHYIGFDTETVISERIFSLTKGGILKGSARSRILAFKLFAEFFPKNPILGAGAKISNELEAAIRGQTSQIHVGYLSLFYYYGFIGGMIYVLFIFYLTKHLFNNAKLHKNFGPFYGFILLLFSNLTLVYLVPFEAGLFLCFLFDRYYYFGYLNKTKK